MTTVEQDFSYRGELGPVIEVPVKLRIPKNLYDIWNEITSKHPGWAPDRENNRGFEYEVNWEILKLYMNYLGDGNEIVMYEAIGKSVTQHLLAKYNIDTAFLQKVDSDHDYIMGILEARVKDKA